MANKDDYLTYYREFFENFAQSMNPNDQLPVKLASYKLVNVEVVGGIIDWASQYLTQKKCPPHLVAPLIKIVIDEIRKSCKKQPVICGFNPKDNAYEPLKLMQTVMAKINEVCLRYLDNSMLCSLPSPGTPYFVTSVCAVKNSRRRMEDRHVVIHDLNTMFNIQEASPSSYYAVFDGHAGHDAAAYSSAHLHQFLAEDKHFIANPEQALIDAFCKTDTLFIDKCKVENLSSGTTALVALMRPKEKTLYVAWAGDSLALLANQGRILQIVDPHKPSRPDEKERIEKQGGCVMLWGTWRVNGQLAVSRAIGDSEYKPHVTAIPEVREIPLDGGEDFLILACDGLWDFVSEDCAARAVYRLVTENSDDTDRISTYLAQLAKEQGSTDNISVIIVFLREPSKIAAEAHWANRNCPTNTMETGLDNANNPFAMPNGAPTDNILSQKTEGLLLNLSDNFKRNGTDISPTTEFYNKEKTNGKRSASEFDDDDDFGPETNIDTIDDAVSPSAETAKSFDNAIFKDTGLEGHFNPFMEHQEKAALEIERSLQKKEREYCEDDDDEDFEEGAKEERAFEASQFIAQKLDDKFDEQFEDKFKFDEQRLAREETPTPPADTVHDVGGLDNAAESDSEDEWNYIKGETANKENIAPQPEKEVADIPEEEDNMSQLNPNAAEFVPVSPTRSIPSPACRTLLNDEVISQSPKRATQEIDINLPNPNDFASEVKSRPSEVDSFNGHSDTNVSKPSDLMENLLNGKNIDEIPEFHPGSTPKKTVPSDEFHFGPNAAPFTPAKLLDQSEALSTKAVYGDESTATLGTTFNESTQESSSLNKESDPMNMSFYGDKSDNNPFDLNKVQVLPDNVDEFLNQPDNSTFNETISDLPEHHPLGEPEKVNRTLNLNNDEAILMTDLDKHSYDDEKELASPLEPERELMAEDESEHIKTPEPTHENLLGDFVESEKPKTPQSDPEVQIEPIKEATEVADLLQEKPLDLPEDVELISPELTGKISTSPKPEENIQQAIEVQDLLQTSEPIEVPDLIEPYEEKVESVFPIDDKLDPIITEESKSPIPELEIKSTGSHPVFSSFSPAFDQPKSPIPERVLTPDYTSPEIVEKAQEHFEDLCQPQEVEFTSPDLLEKANDHFEELCHPKDNIESPQEVTSSVKDDELISPVDDNIIDQSFISDTSNLMVEEVKNVVTDISNDAILIPEHTDTESVTTAEVNSFLERSLPPDVTSPIVSPIDLPVKETELLIHTQGEEIDIKTERITPEFAVQAVVTPSEESKHEDVPILEETFIKETVEEKKAEVIKEPIAPVEMLAATTAAAAAVAGIAAVATASPAVKEEKKSSTAISKKSSVKSTTTAKAAPKSTTTKPLSSARTAPSKTGAAKPLTTAASPRLKPIASPATASKPRISLSSTPKSTEKKPVTNGDIKPSPRSSLAAKKEVGAVKTTTSRLSATSVTSKTNATKPAEIKSTSSTRTTSSTTSASRPATAHRTTTTTTQRNVTAAAAAPRRPTTVPPKRPTTLTASKTISNTSTSTTTTTTKSTLTSTSPRTATAKPKVTTTTTTLTARARVPLTKTITKTADTEKQIKESANKITASRSVTSRPPTTTASRTIANTVRKTDSKVSATRTTVSKTSTTTMKSTTAKKPAELVKNVSKTKTTKIEKPKENGVSTVVTEEITVVTTANSVIDSEPQLLKDNSPLDNKLIVDTLIQTNTAAD